MALTRISGVVVTSIHCKDGMSRDDGELESAKSRASRTRKGVTKTLDLIKCRRGRSTPRYVSLLESLF